MIFLHPGAIFFYHLQNKNALLISTILHCSNDNSRRFTAISGCNFFWKGCFVGSKKSCTLFNTKSFIINASIIFTAIKKVVTFYIHFVKRGCNCDFVTLHGSIYQQQGCCGVLCSVLSGMIVEFALLTFGRLWGLPIRLYDDKRLPNQVTITPRNDNLSVSSLKGNLL